VPVSLKDMSTQTDPVPSNREPVASEEVHEPLEKKEKIIEEIKKPVSIGINDLILQAFTEAHENLSAVLLNHNATNPVGVLGGMQVLVAIDDLSPTELAKHRTLLTQVLQRTASAITEPGDEKNLLQLEECLSDVRIKNRIRLATGIGLVILGAAVAALSITVALATFGVGSVLGAWGVAVAGSILIKALSIAAAAVTATAIPVGLIIGHQRPLKSVVNKASLFWQPGNMMEQVEEPVEIEIKREEERPRF
jgi:hypothetical protein